MFKYSNNSTQDHRICMHKISYSSKAIKWVCNKVNRHQSIKQAIIVKFCFENYMNNCLRSNVFSVGEMASKQLTEDSCKG